MSPTSPSSKYRSAVLFLSLIISAIATAFVNTAASTSVVDTCSRTSIKRLSKNLVLGHCSNFNDDSCLCELNGGCQYNMISKTCTNSIDCAESSSEPILCNYRHCYFDCGTDFCSNADMHGSDGCEKGDQCGLHCSNICNCKSSGCQYGLDGRCRSTLQECPSSVFSNRVCGRRNSFYVTENGICRSARDYGTCEIDGHVHGLNLEGPSFTDGRGISYAAGKSHNPVDKHGIALSYELGENLKLSADDNVLYEKIVYANPEKRKNNRCLIYTISICADGTYELILKTMEIYSNRPGEKTFNVRLAGETIVSELDVISLAKETFTPVELIVTFKLKSSILIIHGHEPVLVKNQTIDLEFCYGECVFLEGHFAVAAFSLNKLKELQSVKKTDECQIFDESPWDCISSHCSYNRTSEKCSPPSRDCPEKSNKTCTKCFELLFILDSTSSSRPPHSLVFDRFQEIVNVVDTLQLIYPCSKYGVALFSEKSCHDFRPEVCDVDWGGGLRNHDDPEGCYRRHQVLISDTKALKASSERSKLTFRWSEGGEPGIFASFLAAQDLLIGWTPGTKATKVIVLITDDQSSLAGFDYKAEPKFDGSDSCSKTRHPTIEQIDGLFIREGIALLVVATPGKAANGYSKHMVGFTVPHQVTDISRSPLELAKDIVKLVKV